MENFKFAAEGAWKVLAAGLVLGVGLPTIFALGIRSLAWGSSGVAVEGHSASESNPLGKVAAIVCFAVVLIAVALGILLIVVTGMGKELSFSHVFPTIHDK